MNIKINGTIKDINKKDISISDLLKMNNVENQEMVSVQQNGAFVRKKDFDTTTVKDNDEIDFLYFMGGGAFLKISRK